MPLLTLGVNHKSAPVAIRERVAFDAKDRDTAFGSLMDVGGVHEAAILSTCNRTEVYCRLEQSEPLVRWFGGYHRIDRGTLNPYLYLKEDDDSVRHMLRVASGLDSMVLGEPQILGQLKSAYHDAVACGTLGSIMSRLFQHAFAVAKRVRTDTAIGASPVSVAFAAIALAKQIFGELDQQTALVIGAGETIELAVRHLHGNRLGKLIVANRSLERALSLANRYQGRAIALGEIGEHLHEADIVVSSTASPLPILGKGTVESALKRRRHRPIFMVDIAVPRDIEPEVGHLQDIYLYTVDDLEAVIDQNRRSRQEAADQAEEIVDVHTEHFMGWLRSLNAVETIRAYRDSAQEVREEVQAKALRLLAQGRAPEEALNFLAHTLTNKLLHHPTSQLRQACRDGCDELVEAARLLFDLQEKP